MPCWAPQPHNCKTPSRSNRELLGNTHETHREPTVAVLGVLWVEVAVVEIHAVRTVATVARSRPVVAEGTDIVDRIPVLVARSRQEDCTGTFKGNPLSSCNRVAAEAGSATVGVAQAVSATAPIVGQQDDTVHVVHLRLGVVDAGIGGSCVENIVPLGLGFYGDKDTKETKTMKQLLITKEDANNMFFVVSDGKSLYSNSAELQSQPNGV